MGMELTKEGTDDQEGDQGGTGQLGLWPQAQQPSFENGLSFNSSALEIPEHFRHCGAHALSRQGGLPCAQQPA